MTSTDLFESLGGAPAIAAVVDELYARLVADPRVRHHFEPSRLDALKAGQRAWFTAALTSAPLPVELSAVHARLVITDEQIAAVIGHLDDILRASGQSAYLRRTIIGLVARLWYARNF